MFVVTAVAEGRRAGCLVGFVTQASIEPPRLLVCLSKVNATFEVARRATALAVHFLGSADLPLAHLFGEETGDEVDKFSRCKWRAGPVGLPILLECNGWAAVRVLDRMDCGDHVAHLCEPFDSAALRPGQPQLAYQRVKDLSPGHPAH